MTSPNPDSTISTKNYEDIMLKFLFEIYESLKQSKQTADKVKWRPENTTLDARCEAAFPTFFGGRDTRQAFNKLFDIQFTSLDELRWRTSIKEGLTQLIHTSLNALHHPCDCLKRDFVVANLYSLFVLASTENALLQRDVDNALSNLHRDEREQEAKADIISSFR